MYDAYSRSSQHYRGACVLDESVFRPFYGIARPLGFQVRSHTIGRS